MLHPSRTEVGDVGCRAIGGHAAEFSIVAAGDEARRRGIGCEGECRAVMRFGRAPGFAVGERDETQGSVAECEGHGGAGAIEAGGDDEGLEIALGSA